MEENMEPSQDVAEEQKVNAVENASSEEIKNPSEVSPTTVDGPHETLEPSSNKLQDLPKPPTDAIENNSSMQEPESTEHKTVEVSAEVQDADSYEEFEEEYEEELEENGEVKVFVQKRIVRIKKKAPSISKDQAEEEEQVEEDYEEEELDENGEMVIITKKRIIKVKKTPGSRRSTVTSFTEQEEEYEAEEVNEEGETVIVRKVRLIKVPKKIVSKESEKSFDEVEEEYSEEELDENGEKVIVKKKRIVKVPKAATKKSQEIIAEEDVKSQKSFDVRLEQDSKGEEDVQDVEDKEKSHEEEEVEEEEAIVEEEETIGEIPAEEEVTKRRKKKKIKKDRVSSEEVSELEFEKKSKKRRRHRRKSSKDSETSRSENSMEFLKEEEEDDTLREDIEEEEQEEEGEEEEGEEVEQVSISSSEQRIAEERAAIAEQFEILQKLRSDHVILKKKNFYLSNKLVNYFKKQKMDHVFTETKENPEMEQRLIKKLIQFHDSNLEINEEKLKINSEWEAQLLINEDLSLRVQEGTEALLVRKKELAAKLINSKTGRTILNDKTVEDALTRQEAQQKQLSDCRQLEIKLKRRINAKKQERQMDHMGMDFNLMDYEKLSSLKEYYTDKITERDIEIGEVNEKLASMEEKLRQAKDQLRRRENELDQEQWRLQNISSELDRKRLDLNKVKATRHKTEKNTAKIKQQSGLLAYPMLLKDYEEKAQQLEELTAQTEAMKRSYKNTTRRMERLRETIRRKTLQKYSVYAMSSSNCVKK